MSNDTDTPDPDATPFGYDLIGPARALQGTVEPVDLADAFTEADVFDPGDHTVKEVLAYVEANPDQAEAILAAEADGKARSTILDA